MTRARVLKFSNSSIKEHKTNELGESLDCAFHKDGMNGTYCEILTAWYRSQDGSRCSACPFHKTKQEKEYADLKYNN